MKYLKIAFGSQDKAVLVYMRAGQPWVDLRSLGIALNIIPGQYERLALHRLEDQTIEVDLSKCAHVIGKPLEDLVSAKPQKRRLVSLSALIAIPARSESPAAMAQRADIVDLICRIHKALEIEQNKNLDYAIS